MRGEMAVSGPISMRRRLHHLRDRHRFYAHARYAHEQVDDFFCGPVQTGHMVDRCAKT